MLLGLVTGVGTTGFGGLGYCGVYLDPEWYWSTPFRIMYFMVD